MKTPVLTSRQVLSTLLIAGLMAVPLPGASAQDARFFRLVGPVPTTIIGVTAGGTVTWTNTPTNATFVVQVSATLQATPNWADYIQVPASNAVTAHRIFDPNPPAGMVLIPAGSFTMGNCMAPGEGDSYELPLHTVYVSAFYMDRYEVTSNLWLTVKAWNGGNGYVYENADAGKAANHPVQTVNWRDCVKWCNARSQKEGLVPCYYNESGLSTVYKTGTGTPYPNWAASGYRLPTEAEWEKAARGGVSGHRFPWSDADTINWSRANYYSYWSAGVPYYSYDVNSTSGYNPAWTGGGTPYTTPVGCFVPNEYGLYDMAGSVLEWCWDWWSSTYYTSSPGTDPRGPPSGSGRVLRGGSWINSAIYCRTAYRYYYAPDYGDSRLGFRSVRPPSQ